MKAGENEWTTFDVVFLPRSPGPVRDTLYIHTSHGTFEFKVSSCHSWTLTPPAASSYSLPPFLTPSPSLGPPTTIFSGSFCVIFHIVSLYTAVATHVHIVILHEHVVSWLGERGSVVPNLICRLVCVNVVQGATSIRASF